MFYLSLSHLCLSFHFTLPHSHSVSLSPTPCFSPIKPHQTPLPYPHLPPAAAPITSSIAWQLAKLDVDIIKAGFPAASNDDFEAVKTISKEVGNAVDADGYLPVICGLSL